MKNFFWRIVGMFASWFVVSALFEFTWNFGIVPLVAAANGVLLRISLGTALGTTVALILLLGAAHAIFHQEPNVVVINRADGEQGR